MELTVKKPQEHVALLITIGNLQTHLDMMNHTILIMTQLRDAAHADLAAIKREVDLIDTPELGLANSAPPAKAPAPRAPFTRDEEICTCGHTWEEHHTEGGAEVECGNSYCRCAQFVGTGKPG
jgi:hypothetical protein